MPKVSELTDYERGKIDGLRAQGGSIRQIATAFNRSPTVVHNYLRWGENYGVTPRSGRPSKLSERDRRQILRVAAEENRSCKQILGQVSVRTVNRVLSESGLFEYSEMSCKPRLHKSKRLEFARKYMTWTDKWMSVIFSDGKEFNLDGPDGLRCYWHDVRTEERIFPKRNFGGGLVMV